MVLQYAEKCLEGSDIMVSLFKIGLGLYRFFFRSKYDCLFVSTSFNTFWRLNPCLLDHENSKVHRDCLDEWYELTLRLYIH